MVLQRNPQRQSVERIQREEDDFHRSERQRALGLDPNHERSRGSGEPDGFGKRSARHQGDQGIL